MTYDFFGYKSKLSSHSLHEARDKLNSPNNFASTNQDSLERRLVLANILKKSEPLFEILIFDYAAIAKSRGISIEEAQLKINYIEMELKGTDIVINILDDLIQISVPLGENERKVGQVFLRILGYMKMIALETGYIIYDPQSDKIFDPLKIESIPVLQYLRCSTKLGPTHIRKKKNKKWFKWW